ncbi:MAG: isoprenylcysteine carboxylmethyltransferase family protein [Candidatus Cybelea sp.]
MGCAGARMNVEGWAFGFWQAWTYLAISLVSAAAIAAYLKRVDPKLLERRLRGPAAEKDTSQKLTQLAAAMAFLGTIVLSLLDHRFSWSHVPVVVTIAGCALLAVGYLVIFLSLRENTFAAVNVAVESGQKVISTGPYAIVRHPYYVGLLVWVFATPLALGSWWGLLMLVPMVLVIASRIRYEEGFLNEHLCGYAACCQKLRYRLVPLIW